MTEIQRAQSDLQTDWSVLRDQWNNAAAGWRDATAARFQREFWTSLETDVTRIIQALEELDGAVQ